MCKLKRLHSGPDLYSKDKEKSECYKEGSYTGFQITCYPEISKVASETCHFVQTKTLHKVIACKIDGSSGILWSHTLSYRYRNRGSKK
jgi:hypothetical protein